MKILLVGGGAREHAIAEAIKRSPQKPELIAFAKTKNPGIFQLANYYEIGDIMNFKILEKISNKHQIDFAVIGPDDPIGAGVVDALEKFNIPCVAPKKSLARLESSKSFTRDLMTKYNIAGNLEFKVFYNTNGIKDFMQKLNGEFVVKADGLMGGKGVKVVGDHLTGIEDGFDYAKKCIEEDGRVVVEEKLIGQEFSLMSFADSKTIKNMPTIQDHKRAYENDKGPNTGGMGTYSYPEILPFLTNNDLEDASNITKQIMLALEKECGEPYKGIMYGGFISTKNGIKVIEYNARFGDPEAMNALSLLETDFVKICQAIINQTLNQTDIKFKKQATVCKYVVPNGYPDNPIKGEKIKIGQMPADIKVYYSSVDEKDGELYLCGSRAIAVVGVANDIKQAEILVEKGIIQITGPVFHRSDIGTQKLINQKIEMMNKIKKDDQLK